MKIQLLKPYRRFKIGHVFEVMPDGVANLLIRRKVAAKIEEQTDVMRIGREPGDTANRSDSIAAAIGNRQGSSKHSAKRYGSR